MRYKKRVTFDAVILGGGPAGAAAALSLRQLIPDAKIAIFDGSANGRWRPGEILAPGAGEILQSLGCWQSFLNCGFLESYGTKAAWGSEQIHENDFMFSLRGNGWRLNRASFDTMLLACARRAGIDVHADAPILDSREIDNRWSLQLRGHECDARFVIDASGRTAAWR